MRKFTLTFDICRQISRCHTRYLPYSAPAAHLMPRSHNRSGEPVMLLGYDPVAYFTRASPRAAKRSSKPTCQTALTTLPTPKTKHFLLPTPPNTSRNTAVFAPAGQLLPSNWAAIPRLGKSTTGDCSFLAMY